MQQPCRTQSMPFARIVQSTAYACWIWRAPFVTILHTLMTQLSRAVSFLSSPWCMSMQWDALDEAEKAKYPFEQDLKRRMDGIIADVMKKIDRNKERLAAQDTPLITPADQVRRSRVRAEPRASGRLRFRQLAG